MKYFELKIHPPVITTICVLLAWGLHFIFPWFDFHNPYKEIFTLICFASAALLGLSGILVFMKSSTTIDPMKPEKSSTLIIEGIYRKTRNPMYLGLTMGLLGCCFYFSNYLSFTTVPLLVVYLTQFQIKPEERILEEKFGAKYENYKQQVRRWV